MPSACGRIRTSSRCITTSSGGAGHVQTQVRFLTGTIVQINISRGGLPKRPVPEAVLTPLGLEGDAQRAS